MVGESPVPLTRRFAARKKKTMARMDLIIGDLRIVDDEEKGLSVYHVSKPTAKLCWVNLKGERELLEWLSKKPKTEEERSLGGISAAVYRGIYDADGEEGQ